jgi:isochorismate synthase EntC
MDAEGDGDWVVGLRSCVLAGSDAVVWAGAGIVAASDPDAELAETDLKLAVVLEALTPSAATRVESRQLRS